MVPPTTLLNSMPVGPSLRPYADSLIRDDQCRVFLDHDADLMTIIINFLRTKKIQDKSKPALSPPSISDAKKEEFETIWHHYGLLL